jgi:digeranylgeranylglycerophospholipid reductase
MSGHPDILIVGLGPAGASAAAAAARAGVRVMAIDRRKAAGLPVQCAEFVPRMLGADVVAVNRSRIQGITRMDTYLMGDLPEVTPDFQGVMIDRAAFDAALVDEAIAAGADVHFNTPLREIGPEGAIIGDGLPARPRLVIAADGPRSRVGRAIGLVNREMVETRQIRVPLSEAHAATDIFLNPKIEGGYAWFFPRGAEANLGLGLVPSRKARLRPLLEELHKALVADGRVGETASRLTGGPIPVGGIIGLQGKIGDIPALLAGDAAGLANPITGAGISSATTSGRMAGEAAAAWLKGDADALDDYAEEVNDLFGPSLRLALKRRQELVDTYETRGEPEASALRAGWIAYPEYWARPEAAPTAHQMEALHP